MSRILSSCVCSIMSVVLLLSIFTTACSFSPTACSFSPTACSFSPTAVTLRCCTRQPNGKQSVNQSINQPIDRSIKQKTSSDCIYMIYGKTIAAHRLFFRDTFICLVICWVIHSLISFFFDCCLL